MDEAQGAGEDDPEIDEDVEDDPENADKEGAAEEDIPAQANLQKEIQIVDLHSDNPLITYNGNAYSCRWASHVGTELLFKAHERDSTIPILRKLNGGVDLLAVNQARIISDPLELQPRKRKRSPERAFVRGSHIPHTKYLIPIGAHASARRKDQAVFLERMINMKVEMGETDAVTVVAEKRLSNNRWKARIKDMRDKERATLNKTLDNASDGEEEDPDVEAAKQRLQDMDEEDERVAKLKPSLGKRRVAARMLRRDPRGKVVEVEPESPAPAASPAPNVPPRTNKPKRGRPPKTLFLPKKVVDAVSQSATPSESAAAGTPRGEAPESADAVVEADNPQQHSSDVDAPHDLVDDEDNFYSAREGT